MASAAASCVGVVGVPLSPTTRSGKASPLTSVTATELMGKLNGRGVLTAGAKPLPAELSSTEIWSVPLVVSLLTATTSSRPSRLKSAAARAEGCAPTANDPCFVKTPEPLFWRRTTVAVESSATTRSSGAPGVVVVKFPATRAVAARFAAAAISWPAWNVRLPLPSRSVTPRAVWAAPPPLWETARLTCPLASNTPATTWVGLLPTAKVTAWAKLPEPLLARTETKPSRSAVMMSSWFGFPVKLARVTLTGPLPWPPASVMEYITGAA